MKKTKLVPSSKHKSSEKRRGPISDSKKSLVVKSQFSKYDTSSMQDKSTIGDDKHDISPLSSSESLKSKNKGKTEKSQLRGRRSKK